MTKYTHQQIKCIEFFPNSATAKKHLLIEAGAGAGKTSVLTERIKWLLTCPNQERVVNPTHLFLLSFSKDAAQKLSEGIEKRLRICPQTAEVFPLLHISTIDSFFAELVNCIYPTWWEKNKNQSISMPPILQLIDENSVYLNLEKSLINFFHSHQFSSHDLALAIDFILSGGFKRGFFNQSGTLENLLKTMSLDTFIAANLAQMRVVAQTLHPATLFLIERIHEISRKEYIKRLLKGEMTYSDRTVFLKENLLDNIPIKVQEIIIDEYQDTNHIQHAILKNIVDKCQARMIVVGDPKQSIYGFRNASVDVFQNLKNDPSWEHIELKKNFRSSPSLLNEINKLSSLSFSWNNPSIPNDFLNSFFYTEAQKKYIAENPLEAGKELENTEDEKACVHIVSASLNFDSVENANEKLYFQEKLKSEGYNLQSFSFLSYAEFLKNYKEKTNSKWSDFVLLCEQNNDIKKISKIFKQQNIPVQSIIKDNSEKKNSPQNLTALSLAKILAYESDSFDLYQVLQSPLSPMTHCEVEHFFAQYKVNKDFSNSFINCIIEHRRIAQDHFFKAWQLLRWKLVNLHTSDESKENAHIFCVQMEAFAHALNKKLSSPTFRKKLEEKVEQQNIHTSEKNSVFILPQSIDKWDIEFWENNFENTEDLLTIKTVHGAKGLEWKYVCFLPKYGIKKNLGNFLLTQSEKTLDITWLQADNEKMSVVNRVPNTIFSEKDSSIEYNKKGEVTQVHWFSNIRAHLEQEHERKRLFYTAFTRAQNELILFQPIRHSVSKNGLIDDLKNLKSSQLPIQKNLETDVYLRYLDIQFSLRVGKNKVPEVVFSNNTRSAFYNYNFSNDINKLIKNDVCSSTPFSEASSNGYIRETLQTLSNSNSSLDETPKEDQVSLWGMYPKFNSEDNNDLKLENQILKSAEVQNLTHKTLKQKIEVLQKNRELVTKGILYHAAAEIRKPTKFSLEYRVESNCEIIFHELEIWQKQPDKLNFINTSRNILDLVSIFNIEKFLHAFQGTSFCLSTSQNEELVSYLSAFPSESKIVLVLDFKTGATDSKHVEQIANYMKIIQSFLKSGGFFEEKEKDLMFLTIGLIYYNKSENSLLWENNVMLSQPFNNDGKLYFFH